MQIIYLINPFYQLHETSSGYKQRYFNKIKQSKPENDIYPFSFKTHPRGCKTLSCRLFEKIYLTHTELKGHLINVLSATQNLIKL